MTSSAHIDDVKALHISGPVLQRQDGGELPVGGHAGGHVGSMTRAVPLRPVSCEGQPRLSRPGRREAFLSYLLTANAEPGTGGAGSDSALADAHDRSGP